jgi:hypothetical protein
LLNNSNAQEQLDYGASLPAPIDTVTFVLLTSGIVLSVIGTTITVLVIIKHNGKHHIYRVASGHSVPIPAKSKAIETDNTAFAIGQSEASLRQAQISAKQDIPTQHQPAQTEHEKQTATIKVNVE